MRSFFWVCSSQHIHPDSAIKNIKRRCWSHRSKFITKKVIAIVHSAVAASFAITRLRLKRRLPKLAFNLIANRCICQNLLASVRCIFHFRSTEWFATQSDASFTAEGTSAIGLVGMNRFGIVPKALLELFDLSWEILRFVEALPTQTIQKDIAIDTTRRELGSKFDRGSCLAPNYRTSVIRNDFAGAPMSSLINAAYSASNSCQETNFASFTQRFSLDNFPPNGR